MAKKRKQYTADELREMEKRLLAKERDLAKQIAFLSGEAEAKGCSFDAACDLRDAAQMLVSVCHAMTDIDDFIRLADIQGPKTVPFDPVECGIE